MLMNVSHPTVTSPQAKSVDSTLLDANTAEALIVQTVEKSAMTVMDSQQPNATDAHLMQTITLSMLTKLNATHSAQQVPSLMETSAHLAHMDVLNAQTKTPA